jgi:hypothetical protein
MAILIVAVFPSRLSRYRNAALVPIAARFLRWKAMHPAAQISRNVNWRVGPA